MPADTELLEAIGALRDGVDALNTTLREDYPKREEIEKDRRYFASLTTLGIVVGMIAATLITIGTVSTCFLSRSAFEGHAPGFCGAMPGYSASQARSQASRARNDKVFQDITKNKAINERQRIRILRLEKAVGIQ